MKFRHIALIAGSLLVMAALIAVFFEVKRGPATVNTKTNARTARPPEKPAPRPRVEKSDSPEPSKKPSSSQNSERLARSKLALERARAGAARTSDDRRRSSRKAVVEAAAEAAKETAIEAKSLKERMDEANRRYEVADYDGAITQARSILAENPLNIRMLRVVIASGCLMGDEELAREYHQKLPDHAKRAKRDMRVRCSRYGVEL